MICAGMVNAQAKVYSSGKIVLGDNAGIVPSEAVEVNGNMQLLHASGNNSKLTNSTNNMILSKTVTSGQALIDINPIVTDGSSNASFRFFRNTSSTGLVKFDVHRADGTSAVQSRFSANADTYLNRYSGNVGVGLTGPSSKLDVAGDISINGVVKVTSDKRLKKNVKSFEPGLETVLNINPVTFQYNGKANTKNNSTTFIGVVAQELEKVAPYLVEKFDYTNHDDEGNIIESEEYLRINDSEIKYLLINAIKEQQEIIDGLVEEVHELTNVIKGSNSDTEVGVDLSTHISNNLGQNQPNPYTEQTVIEYTISKSSKKAVMNFYNLNGQLLKTVPLANGSGRVVVSADELPAGTYSYSLEVDGEMISNKKMVKMR